MCMYINSHNPVIVYGVRTIRSIIRRQINRACGVPRQRVQAGDGSSTNIFTTTRKGDTFSALLCAPSYLWKQEKRFGDSDHGADIAMPDPTKLSSRSQFWKQVFIPVFRWMKTRVTRCCRLGFVSFTLCSSLAILSADKSTTERR